MFYSYDLQDAINLAKRSLEEDAKTFLQRADFHIKDIEQYDKNSKFIKYLNMHKTIAKRYLTDYNRLVTLTKSLKR